MTDDVLVPPIHRAAVYEFATSAELARAIGDHHHAYTYGRYDNPTVVALEETIARLEGAPRALAFGSGMAAITTAVLGLTPRGGTIVHQTELYGGTVEFFRDFAPNFGYEVRGVPAGDLTAFEGAVREGAHVVYVETPINPTLALVDLRRVARVAREVGALTLADNTFATPLGQHPLELGIDVSLHSATKFLGGHHDVIAGVLATSQELGERIWKARKTLGGILSPSDAFLLRRGVKTLALRLAASTQSAAALAEDLHTDPRVRRVHYPGHPSHAQHALCREQMRDGGAMISFELETDREGAESFVDALTTFRRAPSLGGIESTAMVPAQVSHAGLSSDERQRMGVGESLIRFSVGTEPIEALREDVRRGFAALDAR